MRTQAGRGESWPADWDRGVAAARQLYTYMLSRTVRTRLGVRLLAASARGRELQQGSQCRLGQNWFSSKVFCVNASVP